MPSRASKRSKLGAAKGGRAHSKNRSKSRRLEITKGKRRSALLTAKRSNRKRDDDHRTRQIAATAIAIAAGRLHVCGLHNEPYASPRARLTDPNQVVDKLMTAKETRAIF